MRVLILLSLIFMVGCGATKIAKEDYSQLETPQQTFDFLKKAVKADDPDAFYFCFADYIKAQFSFDQFIFAWALAGNLFSLVGQVEIEKVETPTPDLPQRQDLAKVSVKLQKLEAAFLLMKEQNKWKIANPQHYGLPDISQLPTRERLPWRTMARTYNTQNMEDWDRKKYKGINTKKKKTPPKSIPWRRDQRGKYQTTKDWYVGEKSANK
ncbi:hypothetical protein [Candidatus Uabimicrobium sp. HlEnr_7]|uniref:hypothetical protein n=1 Tax=Candidatus Uabimicrobium helgolandensis TaxID=3095367 RepID=UPI003556AB5C